MLDKRFSYIDKASDLTLDMIKNYRDSLIILGDERQLYNPLTNSYIGLGMTAYNYILNCLNAAGGKSVFYWHVDNNKEYKLVFNDSNNNEFESAYTSRRVTFNPATWTLTSQYFKGDLKGKAELSNYSYYSQYSYNMMVENTNQDSSYYLTMSNSSTTGEYSYSYVNQDLQYNPNMKVLSTSYFDGQVDPADQWGIMGSE